MHRGFPLWRAWTISTLGFAIESKCGTRGAFGDLCYLLHKVFIVTSPHGARIQLRGERVDGEVFGKKGAFSEQYAVAFGQRVGTERLVTSLHDSQAIVGFLRCFLQKGVR